MSSQMETETKQQQKHLEQMEELPAQQSEQQPEKKQELKDFSLSTDVLIKELSEAEIAKLLSVPKKVCVNLELLIVSIRFIKHPPDS